MRSPIAAAFSSYSIGVITSGYGYNAAVWVILIGSELLVAILGLLFVPSKEHFLSSQLRFRAAATYAPCQPAGAAGTTRPILLLKKKEIDS